MAISDGDMQAAREFCIKRGHPYGPDFKLVAEAVATERERCAKLVPTNWCDELLSGKDAPLPLNGRDVEALLRGIQDRIRKSD